MTNREIDALVAEHVMGWVRVVSDYSPLVAAFSKPGEKFESWKTPSGYTGIDSVLSHFSTDPAASKRLRDKMRADGWTITSGEAFYPATQKNGFWCRLFRHNPWQEFSHDNDESAESVFALAALKAKGVEVEHACA